MDSERFWSKVDRGGVDDCWPWLGSIQKNGPKQTGYGQIRFGGKQRLAHQVALELDGRPRPQDGLFALHSCNNSLCVNPKHLRWGTRWDNTVDGFKAGTIQRAFTDEEAAEVRADPRLQREIAAEHGVSQVCVSKLKTGRSYRQKAGV